MSQVRRPFEFIIEEHSKKLSFIYHHYTLAVNIMFVWLNPCVHIDQFCIDIVNQYVYITASEEQVRVVSKWYGHK